MHGNSPLYLARLRLLKLSYSYDSLSILTREQRAALIAGVIGEETISQIWPTNGVILAILCLHMGAPEVVMTGFSLTKSGHAYNDANRERFQVEDDRRVLQRVQELDLPISTNDPEFASESGLPLRSSLKKPECTLSCAVNVHEGPQEDAALPAAPFGADTHDQDRPLIQEAILS